MITDDKAKLHELPHTGFAPSNADIAKHLRELADWIDEDDAAQLRSVFLTIEYMDGSVSRRTMGHPCDLARALGVTTISIVRSVMGVEG